MHPSKSQHTLCFYRVNAAKLDIAQLVSKAAGFAHKSQRWNGAFDSREQYPTSEGDQLDIQYVEWWGIGTGTPQPVIEGNRAENIKRRLAAAIGKLTKAPKWETLYSTETSSWLWDASLIELYGSFGLFMIGNCFRMPESPVTSCSGFSPTTVLSNGSL